MVVLTSPITWVIVGLIVIWNIVSFALFAIDKKRAEANKWRIKEATLFLSAFAMGGVGALLGMNLLRHKTKHMSFKILIPLAVLVNIIILAGVFFLLNMILGSAAQ